MVLDTEPELVEPRAEVPLEALDRDPLEVVVPCAPF